MWKLSNGIRVVGGYRLFSDSYWYRLFFSVFMDCWIDHLSQLSLIPSISMLSRPIDWDLYIGWVNTFLCLEVIRFEGEYKAYWYICSFFAIKFVKVFPVRNGSQLPTDRLNWTYFGDVDHSFYEVFVRFLSKLSRPIEQWSMKRLPY